MIRTKFPKQIQNVRKFPLASFFLEKLMFWHYLFTSSPTINHQPLSPNLLESDKSRWFPSWSADQAAIPHCARRTRFQSAIPRLILFEIRRIDLDADVEEAAARRSRIDTVRVRQRTNKPLRTIRSYTHRWSSAPLPDSFPNIICVPSPRFCVV